ncbi:MAG: SDR family oxidoreductase [Acetobacteraceae bacterium]
MDNVTVTVVTGGGSGIGAALCRMLAAPGQAIVVHTGTKRGNAEAVAAEVAAAGALSLVSVHDFHEPERAGAVIAEAEARFGRVDRVVHLAAFADRRPIGALDAAGYETALAASPRAFFHLMTAALPALQRSPAGRVVSVGSFMAHAYRLGDDFLFPATSSAKAALVGLTKSLAMQLAASGVTVNCVVPGFIQKDPGQHTALDDAARARVAGLVPMRRFGQPGEVAAAIRFLLSAEAGYITGQTIHVDGGIVV